MHTGTGHTEQDDERDHSGSHMGNSGVSIASGIKQLSAADRATLVATIRTYLVSKGIVLPVESTGSTQTGSTLSGTTTTGMSDIAALRPFIQKLSATDRATLVATIHTYLVSKGIVLRTEAIRDEMKQIKKDIHKAMKTMRKNMHDTLKQKQREMKEQLEDSK